jgi:hypothetical protein
MQAVVVAPGVDSLVKKDPSYPGWQYVLDRVVPA